MLGIFPFSRNLLELASSKPISQCALCETCYACLCQTGLQCSVERRKLATIATTIVCRDGAQDSKPQVAAYSGVIKKQRLTQLKQSCSVDVHKHSVQLKAQVQEPWKCNVMQNINGCCEETICNALLN